MKVTVLKAFDAYPDGKSKKHFPVGDADIPKKLVTECNMVENGLVAAASKLKPETE